MAIRKPLVINSGAIQQLQSGDTIDVAFDVISLQNSNAGTINIGEAVYSDGAGTVDLAQANASGTVQVVGLVQPTSIASAASGAIMMDGVLAATTGQWDACAGTTGGLTAGTVYYLDPSTAGDLTATATTTVGQYVVRIGKAISTTELEISIQPPILL